MSAHLPLLSLFLSFCLYVFHFQYARALFLSQCVHVTWNSGFRCRFLFLSWFSIILICPLGKMCPRRIISEWKSRNELKREMVSKHPVPTRQRRKRWAKRWGEFVFMKPYLLCANTVRDEERAKEIAGSSMAFRVLVLSTVIDYEWTNERERK